MALATRLPRHYCVWCLLPAQRTTAHKRCRLAVERGREADRQRAIGLEVGTALAKLVCA